MKRTKTIVIGGILAASIALITLFVGSQIVDDQTAVGLIAGRNVNMVSGTTLPDGDPWLQRQNEPSVAVSTRNPLHLLAGANDYRTVDMPFSEGELPSIFGVNAGDAWLGIFKSFDGGESWKTSLLPGFPQDISPEGIASPLKQYSAAADPIVRSGTNGLFYYSGMAFNRDQLKGGGALFVSRFIDNNDVEGGDSIKYLDTRILDQGTLGQFIDMPRIAVDMPRGTGTMTIDGQPVPRSNVYAVYTVFLGNTDVNIHSRIMFRRSTDCGQTWGSAVKITESQHVIQGATIAINPYYGTVYVAYRRFLHPAQTNAMVIVKSADFGQTFTAPVVIANINPFDQPTTEAWIAPPAGTSFRTNSYPTMTVDEQGIVYVAWTERGLGPAQEARIVMYTSQGGTAWSGPFVVENTPDVGHQFMPFLTYAGGKLTLAWYDQRESCALAYGVDGWVSDGVPIRQTIDVRTAQADPGLQPAFEPSVQVSRYLWALFDDGSIQQVQYNPPNYPLFKGGTVPFAGDYIEVTPSPMFVRSADGTWTFNTAPSSAPVFHVVWADNRDVRPPDDGVSWDTYTPPASDQGLFGTQDCLSVDLEAMGMRNQNIYTSALTRGLVAAAPANTKPLGDDLGTYLDTTDPIPRAFVVYIKNPTEVMRGFRLSIDSPPANGTASFLEFESLTSLDVMIAAYSTIARTVFVRSTDLDATVTIGVIEIDWAGYEVPGGLTGDIVLNPDPTTPLIPSTTDEYHNPNIRNSDIVNWAEVPSPNIRNADIINPTVVNPNIRNEVVNPNIVNPNIRNTGIVNPTVVNADVANPNIRNDNIVNTTVLNPNIRNESLEDADVYDVTATVVNDGNTTTAYTLKTFSKEAFPDDIYLQLLVYKATTTPAADEDGDAAEDCLLKVERHHDLLLNVVNPNIRNPNIVNPNIRNPNIRNESIENATIALAPGEEADLLLRIIRPADAEIFDVEAFAESVGFAATSHAVNTYDARVEGETLPPATASKLIIGTSSLPDGVVGTSYLATLVAYGGTEPCYWALNSGELPPGLFMGADGTISGTPTSAGLYSFIARVDDSLGDFDTQLYSIYVDNDGIPDPLTVMTVSLPGGVLDHWYGAALEATGGTWPRTWSLTSGSLPPGLELDSDGVISGTLRQEEEQDYPTVYNFSVTVADMLGATATGDLSLAVAINTGVDFTISGIVFDETTGAPLDGVVMRGLPNTPVTGTFGIPGYYEDTVPEGWAGTVIPFKADHSFTPESRDYFDLSSDAPNQDYNEAGGMPAQIRVETAADGTGTVVPAQYVPIGSFITVYAVARDAGGNFIENVAPDSWSLINKTGGVEDGDLSHSEDLKSADFTGHLPGSAQIRASKAGLTSVDSGVLTVSDVAGLVAHYPFDGDAIDASGNGNNGVVYGGASYVADWAGNPNGAIALDGIDDYVELPNESNFDLTTWSIVAVVKIPDYIRRNPIISKGSFGNYTLHITPTSGEPYITYDVLGGNETNPLAMEALPVNQFVHIAATYDYPTRQLKGYINGIPEVTLTTDNVPVLNDVNATIGLTQQFLEYFNGVIDDVRLYNRVLTPSEIESLYLLHAPIYEFVLKWGSEGTGDGQFRYPFDVAIDSSGIVYVTDCYNDRIQKFTSEGAFVAEWGSEGTGDGQLRGPFGIAVDGSGYVYVVDQYNDRIQKFTSEGAFVANWGSSGTGDGQFNTPTGIAVDGTEPIYVADTWNYRIQKFTAAGDFETTWGSSGDGDGQFDYHMGITVDSSGNVYVADTDHHRIQKFTSMGTFLGWWGRDDLGNSGWHNPDSGRTGVSGTGDGEFSRPIGVATDSSGNVYVADFINHRIQKFTSTGAFLTKWGSFGIGDGEFNLPMGIAVDSSGNVYVTEYENNRIQKFRKK
jgi:hypothetical protein